MSFVTHPLTKGQILFVKNFVFMVIFISWGSWFCLTYGTGHFYRVWTAWRSNDYDLKIQFLRHRKSSQYSLRSPNDKFCYGKQSLFTTKNHMTNILCVKRKKYVTVGGTYSYHWTLKGWCEKNGFQYSLGYKVQPHSTVVRNRQRLVLAATSLTQLSRVKSKRDIPGVTFRWP